MNFSALWHFSWLVCSGCSCHLVDWACKASLGGSEGSFFPTLVHGRVSSFDCLATLPAKMQLHLWLQCTTDRILNSAAAFCQGPCLAPGRWRHCIFWQWHAGQSLAGRNRLWPKPRVKVKIKQQQLNYGIAVDITRVIATHCNKAHVTKVWKPFFANLWDSSEQPMRQIGSAFHVARQAIGKLIACTWKGDASDECKGFWGYPPNHPNELYPGTFWVQFPVATTDEHNFVD